MVLTLDSFIFFPTDGDIERAWSDTGCVPLFQLLVGRGSVDRRPLTLANVDQFVEQDGVFSVQVDVLL